MSRFTFIFILLFSCFMLSFTDITYSQGGKKQEAGGRVITVPSGQELDKPGWPYVKNKGTSFVNVTQDHKTGNFTIKGDDSTKFDVEGLEAGDKVEVGGSGGHANITGTGGSVVIGDAKSSATMTCQDVPGATDMTGSYKSTPEHTTTVPPGSTGTIEAG